MPEIKRTNSTVITTRGTEMTMEELRKAMRRIEEDDDAGKGGSETQQTSAARAVSTRPNFRGKCHRCNQPGHWKNECPLKNTNRWFCYTCNREVDHDVENCPYKSDRTNSGYKRPRELESGPSGPPANRGRGASFPGNRRRGASNYRGRQNRGRGSGNFRGRGAYQGQRQSAARGVLQEDEEEYQEQDPGNWNQKYDDQPGKHFYDSNLKTKTQVEFIADSGATEHFVNKSFILSNFKVSKNGVIKSANKNEFADIVIDGRGNLLLKNNTYSEDKIKLANVIAAKDLSENLLSLRKIVDAGFSITLNDKIQSI